MTFRKPLQLKRGLLARLQALGLAPGEPALALDDPTKPKLLVGDKNGNPVEVSGGSGGISIVWHGAWDAIHAYALNDAVPRYGSSYICVQPHTGQDPATDTAHTYWSVLAAQGVAGGGGPAHFSPDFAPFSPSALDDEFSVAATALDARWTTINWSALSAVDVNTTLPGQLYLKRVGTSPIIGAVQALPAGDFTIFSKLRCSPAANYYGAGLVITDSKVPGAGSQTLIGMAYNSALYRRIETFTNWTSQGATTNYAAATVGAPTYLRIRRVGSAYFAAWSPDGFLWEEVTFTPGAAPVYFGIYEYTTYATTQFSFEFIRYFDSGTAKLGNYGGVWNADLPPATVGSIDDEFVLDNNAWSWVNQESATYKIRNSRLIISAPAIAGDKMRCRVRQITGSSWTVSACIAVQPKSVENWGQGGLLLRNSASGKILILTMAYNSSEGGWRLYFNNFSSPTTYTSTIARTLLYAMRAYLRFACDGISVSAYYSLDGGYYTLLGSTPLASFIGSVDQVGLYASSCNATNPVDLVCDWIRQD